VITTNDRSPNRAAVLGARATPGQVPDTLAACGGLGAEPQPSGWNPPGIDGCLTGPLWHEFTHVRATRPAAA